MKSIYALLFLLITITHAPAQGIEFFEGSFDEALEKAKSEDKIIFVDCYTTWCGPCKAMAKNTFTDPEVGQYFNQHFINLKLDMEKDEGVKFGHTFPVSAYPTLYFIGSTGDVVKKVVGGQNPEGLIMHGKSALTSFDRSGEFEEQYNAGNRDYDLVYQYVKALNQIGKPTLKISNDYLNSAPDISREQRLRFLFEAAVEADSKLFEELIENKEAVIALLGEEAFTHKVKKACQATFQKAIDYEFEGLMDEAIDKSRLGMAEESALEFEYTSKMAYYETFGQDDKYLDTAEDFVKELGNKRPGTYAMVAVDVCNNLPENQKALKKANKWAKEAYKKEANETNFTAYCRTLIALGELEDAQKLLKKALDEYKENGYSPMNIKRLLNYTEEKIRIRN